MKNDPLLSLSGTPTEDSWPGISNNDEFRSYMFSQYRPQPLINHVPRLHNHNKTTYQPLAHVTQITTKQVLCFFSRLDTEGIDMLTALLLVRNHPYTNL